MNRTKRLAALGCAAAAACIGVVVLSRIQTTQDAIRESGEVVLSIDPETVQSVSWEYGNNSYAFHRDGDWVYDADTAFLVDPEKMDRLLSPFEAMGAAFIIEEPASLSEYGLDDPVCTIELTTEGGDYTILLGDYSTMDEQRYVSIGDGKVYLAVSDPLDEFDATLADLIQNDAVPDFETVTAVTFSGAENYSFTLEENGTSYRDEDRYFADGLPLDTDRVEDYLLILENLRLNGYVTYNATEEEIAGCGLDSPDLTITVDYTETAEDGSSEEKSFAIALARDPEEAAAAESGGTGSGTSSGEETVTAYARVGDSPILYQIDGSSYLSLMAAGISDLRHQEIFPAETETIAALSVTLQGQTYSLTSEGDGEERTFSYDGKEIDAGDLLQAIGALEADAFTGDDPTGTEEISLTATLDLEGGPAVSLSLYRVDGSNCLAVVDGTSVALVPRTQVVTLIEAVNAIVLG